MDDLRNLETTMSPTTEDLIEDGWKSQGDFNTNNPHDQHDLDKAIEDAQGRGDEVLARRISENEIRLFNRPPKTTSPDLEPTLG